MNLTILQNRLVIAVIAAFIGAVLTILIQRFLNKRGLFTYFVWHNRIGVSADDAIFGSVRVTWNDNPVANLYSSTVELRNESLNDYENVVVRVFTSDTLLLTERTENVGTTHFLEWNKAFVDKLTVPSGSKPTTAQINIVNSQREYLIPTFNRGQLVRFNFLNTANAEIQPSLWLDIVHKGIKIKFCIARNKFMGIPQNLAAIMGSFLGFVLFGIVIAFVDIVWIAALISLVYGLFVLVPGALTIKLLRWLRDCFGD